MSFLHVLRAIISGSREGTQVMDHPKMVDITSGGGAPHQVLPDAYDQMVGFTDMGGFGNINSWWLP
jgi:hypothetical protein